jgi:ubiquinone/menaquinone biosynthesis C-methylase UbiE
VTHESRDYHLAELRVAQDPTHARHILPPVRPEHRRVLDIGCGAGQTLIAGRRPASTLTIGLDPSLAALSVGRSFDAHLRVVCAQGEWLPFPDRSFDFVYSRVALPYMNISRAVAEMARVLESGGTLWLTLHPWSRVVRDTFAEARLLRPRAAAHGAYVLANGLTFHLSGKEFAWPFGRRGYESFQTARGMRRALTRAGFRDVSIETERFFVVTAKRE